MTTFRARIVATIVLAFAIAACGENSGGVTAPERASYDGGHTFGGGNRTDTTTTTTATSGEAAVVNSGGHTFGGGN